ncbi:lysine 2,3-aminomutase [Desulfobaculum xiamenense]|uniref:L-lysine 2,3-aminomutase n=1 Tax=Desulfobaculum xiamenense TaxID=995050 RepID=A0A846QMQ2_9BACT|nr:KamA family radical SAM protein [Desulfobaculum xiamenense]NJB68300.1 lysine 2,3-aminomutase [Desulfobaculum xiamenense]
MARVSDARGTIESDARAARRKAMVKVEVPVINKTARAFRDAHFPGVDDATWNDWRWQVRNRLSTVEDFRRMLGVNALEAEAIAMQGLRLPVAVTPYYASLLTGLDCSEALRRCVIPAAAELDRSYGECGDPLAEDHDSPVPGIVHRYPDRVLFIATDICSTYCRYCTRSRLVGRKETRALRTRVWDQAIDYVRRTPQVRDVLVSGGDPFLLPDSALEYILSRLRAIPHVEMLRLGTKTPMVLPQRITPALVRMLKRYHPLFVSIHCTHPGELTPEAGQACARLADAGIPLGSQTVLLSGVNDNTETMLALMRGLLKNRVRPYYLYQCDQVEGTAHFRTPLSRGIEIMRGLRGFTSGYAIPHFVVDLPGGGGKTPVLPEYFQGRDGDELIFKNYEGREFRTLDPLPSADTDADRR